MLFTVLVRYIAKQVLNSMFAMGWCLTACASRRIRTASEWCVLFPTRLWLQLLQLVRRSVLRFSIESLPSFQRRMQKVCLDDLSCINQGGHVQKWAKGENGHVCRNESLPNCIQWRIKGNHVILLSVKTLNGSDDLASEKMMTCTLEKFAGVYCRIRRK